MNVYQVVGEIIRINEVSVLSWIWQLQSSPRVGLEQTHERNCGGEQVQEAVVTSEDF